MPRQEGRGAVGVVADAGVDPGEVVVEGAVGVGVEGGGVGAEAEDGGYVGLLGGGGEGAPFVPEGGFGLGWCWCWCWRGWVGGQFWEE